MRLAETVIRPAREGDAQAVCDIYAFHVAHSTATFDAIAPDAAQWTRKIGEIAGNGWPFLVAAREGEVLGYCYAARLRDRAAYARTCENSIYVAEAARGTGIGTGLLAHLIDAARACGFEQMIAVIGGGEPASVALHARCGFVHAGRLRNVGFKFGRRLDTVYMQRDLT
ncbi:MAG: GNAT family N-acetyltransferase [Erythrobacteraceae bacterium]|jgi:phosphinothricin acetyltransferase|nr:GNAT family N-acetyltransferase [Erythrobacteraceae bacterium]